MEEQVPDWFENLDDDELDRRERRPHSTRLWVALITVLIVLGLAVIPTLDLLDLRPGAGRTEPQLSPMRRVAWDFGIAVLMTRSAADAMRFAAPGQGPAIEAVIADLQRLDARLLEGAQVGISAVRCIDPVPAGAECFLAWLYQTGQPEFARIVYVVSGEPDGPLVIHVERVEPSTAAR